MALLDTPWSGAQTNKMFLQSGKFSSTILTSSTLIAARGITFDGVDTYSNESTRLYLISGQFTSTIKDSLLITAVNTVAGDISFDGTNTPWMGSTPDKMYLTSGAFTSTIITSEVYGNTQSSGISYDIQGNTPGSGFFPDEIRLMSGQFTTTIIDSLSVSGDHMGISFDGTDTLLANDGQNSLYLTSGQFTSTIIASESIVAADTAISGICTNDFGARTGSFLGIVFAEELAAVFAQPSPTIDLISMVTVIPDPLALGIDVGGTAHVNSNVARPNTISMGANAPDPFIEFGTEAIIGAELPLSFNIWAPTIFIETQTIVTPDTLELTATFEAAVATPDFALVAATLPMFTLSATITTALSFASELPMFTLEATCITGQIFSVIKPLPMLTLDIRAGTKVDIGLPMFTLSATGTGTNGGRLAKPLPLFTLNASGKSSNIGTLDQDECGAVSLPMLTVDIVMALGGIHSFASTLPIMALNGIGTTGGAPGVLEAALPLIEMSASGYSSGNGTLAKSFPIFTLDAFGTSYINRII